MSWKLDKNRPLCPQIKEHICVMIAKGELVPEQKLPSIREVAVDAGVNPNTVQKAFALLEQEGLIYSVPASGWFAADSAELAKEIVGALVKDKTESYFAEMSVLGIDNEQIKQIVKEWEL